VIESFGAAIKEVMGEGLEKASSVFQIFENHVEVSKPENLKKTDQISHGWKNFEDNIEKAEPIQNKQEGLRRENEVYGELKGKYPPEKGFTIESEAYLRDEDGKIARDPVTGEGRRIDFIVTKNNTIVDSIEVTSKTAFKDEQTAKEERIRDNGGNFIRDNNYNLLEVPKGLHTRIERRE
jgi:hypothetical protein